MAASTRVIVIGTGWAGLIAAKTYLQVNPSISLTILTNESTVGGVWSKDRLYPGLVANSPNGLYELTDLSMVDAANPEYDLLPGERVQEYLEKYCEKFDLLSKIRFRSHVTQAVRNADAEGWTLTLESGDTLVCDKLIVSSGLFYKPKWPAIPKEPSFTGTVIHSKTLGKQYREIVSSGAKDVVVVGGCKSAVEAATLFLNCDPAIKVHWVIRPSAQGVPIVVADPAVRPNTVAVSQTRLFSMLGPTVFKTTGFWYWLLHSRRTWVGRKLFDGFWTFMDKTMKGRADYGKSENGRKIQPDRELFWNGGYISLLYKGGIFLQWLHEGERIKVYRETPVRLADGHMEFQSGQRIKADGVVYCTGWHPSIDFFSPEEAASLGVPVPREVSDVKWEKLMANADAEIRKKLPYLAFEGSSACEMPAYSQFRMYRQILSPKLLNEEDRSIAFVGFVATGQTTQCYELLGLWGVAWLEGLLPAELPSEEEMEKDVAKVNAGMARRYGVRGQQEPAIILDAQWFFDLLMRDLGLPAKRKQKGWLGVLKEWLEPYTAADYRGVVDEFLDNWGKKETRT